MPSVDNGRAVARVACVVRRSVRRRRRVRRDDVAIGERRVAIRCVDAFGRDAAAVLETARREHARNDARDDNERKYSRTTHPTKR